MYMKGFNHGYVMASDLAELYKSYSKIESYETEYSKGFKEGAHLAREIDKKKDQNKGKDNGPRFEF